MWWAFTSITATFACIPLQYISIISISHACARVKISTKAISARAWHKCDEKAIFERYTAQWKIPLGPTCCFRRQDSSTKAQHRHVSSWPGNESTRELTPSCFWNSIRTYGTPNRLVARWPEINDGHLSQGDLLAAPLLLWVPDRLDGSADLHHHIIYSCSSKSISVLRLLSCLKAGCANHTPIGETDYTSQTWV